MKYLITFSIAALQIWLFSFDVFIIGMMISGLIYITADYLESKFTPYSSKGEGLIIVMGLAWVYLGVIALFFSILGFYILYTFIEFKYFSN